MQYIEVLEVLYSLGGGPINIHEIVNAMTWSVDTLLVTRVSMHLIRCAASPRNLVKITKQKSPGHGQKNLYSLTETGISRVLWYRDRAQQE